jgi:dihydrofolate reductase
MPEVASDERGARRHPGRASVVIMAGVRGSVFVGVSLDGFIARSDGGLDWLMPEGVDVGDTGYDAFMASVDALVMGRGTYETVLGFGEWPYAGRRVLVLSTTLQTDDDRVEVHDSVASVVDALRAAGAERVYVDGGRTVQTFLRAGLIADLTLTWVPVLIGEGIPLFGPLDGDVHLNHRSTRVLGGGFVQSTYDVAGFGT